MKKIVNVLILALAMNFLLVLCAGGWLFTSGHLDKDKFTEVKKILFPGTQPVATSQPATQPTEETRAQRRLDELVARTSGRPSAEQVDTIRQTFATELAEIDRRERDLQDLQRQIDFARQSAKKDRVKIDQQQKDLAAQEAQKAHQLADQGFQDSLNLYSILPAKQVKTIFMTLSDDTVVQYIEAMQPRVAAKVGKEFKTAEEIARFQKIMEKIRQSQPNSPAVAATP